LSIIPVAPALSQGSFLEKGQDAFAISGSYTTNKDLSGYSGGAGFSHMGVLELGISVGKFSFDRQSPRADLRATNISPCCASYFAINRMIRMNFQG